jgi:excisionase family DNA binding protein
MQQTTEGHPLLLRGVEVAEALGISRALAYRWMASGILPTVRVSRSIRVPRAELLRWIAANTNNPVPANGTGAVA